MQGREGLRRHPARRDQVEKGDERGQEQGFEAKTTDFAEDTDNESIPFARFCTDRFGELRAEVPLHPCHPCHPWLSIPVFEFNACFHELIVLITGSTDKTAAGRRWDWC